MTKIHTISAWAATGLVLALLGLVSAVWLMFGMERSAQAGATVGAAIAATAAVTGSRSCRPARRRESKGR